MAIKAGLRGPGDVPEDPRAGINPFTGVNPAANTGLAALSGDYASAVTMGERPMTGLDVSRTAMQMPQDPFADIEQGIAQQQQAIQNYVVARNAPSSTRLLYSPSRQQFLFNNVVVDANDAEYLSRADEFLQEPIETDLPEGDWVTTDPSYVDQAIQEATDFGVFDRIGIGTRNVAESIVGGTGRIATMLGAERAGGAIEQFGDVLGLTDIQEGNIAINNANSTLWERMLGAVPEGIPSLLASIGGGVAGGLITGGPVGAGIGAFATIFPMMVKSAYDSAATQMGEEFANSAEGSREIATTALANSVLQTIVPARAGSLILRSLAKEGAENAMRGAGRLATGASMGLTEAAAEASAYLVDQAVFDPVVRESLSKEDVSALWPYLVDRHGEELVINAFAGGVLGGGVGLLVGGGRAPAGEREAAKAKENESTDLTVVAGESVRKEDVINLKGQGPQGVLPMEGLGGQIERARRSRDVGYGALPQGQPGLLEAPAPTVDQRQLDLGFAEEVELPEPSRPTALGQELTRQLRQREFEQAVTQRREREEAGAEAQRQQQIAEAEQDQTRPIDLLQPTRGIGEAVPQQQDLFTRRQAPVMSRGEQLRRGIQQPPTTVPDIDQIAPVVQPEVQQELFTRRGQPTAAARVSPVTPAEPGAVYGTTSGAPFTTRNAALMRRQRVSRDTGIPVNELEVVEQDGGFFLRRAGEEIVAPEVAVPPVVEPPPVQQEMALPETEPVVPEAAPELEAEVPSTPEAATAVEDQVVQQTQGAAELAQLTDTEFVNDIIEIIDSTRDPKIYREGVANLLDWAHNADANNKRAGIDARAFEYLSSLPVDSSTHEAIIEFARLQGGPITARDRNGNFTPTFEFILKAGMFNQVRKRFGFKNLPPDMQPAAKDIAVDVETGEQAPTTKSFEAANELVKEILRINKLTGDTTAANRGTYIKNLRKLYNKVVESGDLNFIVDPVAETTIADYFQPDGTPKLIYGGPRGRALRVVTSVDEDTPLGSAPFSEWDASQQALEDMEARIEEQGLGDFAQFGRDGGFSTIDNEPITKAMEPKRVQLAITKFKNNLKKKPKTFVFRTQADLQARNPELYQRAVEARPQGDFDTKLAAGYSFGSGADATVIIFSDRILGNQHLNYVLAHETLGHFGFRSLVPSKKFDDFMQKLYDENGPESALAQEVDAAMAADSTLSLPEAVEEYLADYAAQLDVNLVARIFNFIKNALNRLGVQFADDSARYFISQSRRYVRNGEQSSLIATSDMLRNIKAIESGEDPYGTGRFAPTNTLRSANIMAGTLKDSIPLNHEGAVRWFKGRKIDYSKGFDGFKNQFFNLLVFRARENEGLSAVHDVISQSRDISMAVRREMQEKLAVVLDRAVSDRFSNLPALGGATKAQVETVNRFLYDGLSYALSQYNPNAIGDVRLYTVDDRGNVVANTDEINRLFDMGTLKFEQMRDGFTYTNTYEGEGGTQTETITVEGIPGLTEDSVEWRGYIAARESIKDVELKLLKARNLSYLQERDYAFKDMGTVMKDDTIAPATRQFLDRMYTRYRDLWTENQIQDESGDLVYNPESIERANEFLVALNTALIATKSSATDKEAAERNAVVAEFFPNTPAANIDSAIEDFKSQRKDLSGDERFTIQNRLKDIIVAELSDSQADLATKVTLATGYVPLMRRGDIEVRVEAFDTNGNRVILRQEYKDQLAYRQFEKESEALDIAKKMNDELFGNQTFKAEVYDPDTQQFELKDVRLEATVDTVLDAIAAPPQLNLNEFTRGLRQFNIVLPPRKLQEVISDLTKQNNRARKRLQRREVPGFDPDALRAVAEHVESRAATISKIIMRPKLAELTNRRIPEIKKLWNGDKTKLDRLRAEWEAVRDDPNASEQQKVYARREYNRYAFMYNKTNPEGRAKQGDKYFNEASRLLQFLENNQDIAESDFARGPTVSAIRATTSVMQLGGSIATGALNYMALFTNYIPYMTSYNSKTAFGGGFSFGDSMQELYKSMDQVGLRKSISETRLNTAEFYDQIAETESLQREYGLEPHEARFIATEIREGTMVPAQMNMLTELALGRIKNAGFRRLIEGYMWTFNATERGSRRSAGLAAYRLEYKRRLEAGFSPEQSAEFARQFAVETLRVTLGEYSVTNRPAAWQSGIQSFLYIYKIFPTTSIQMLARLPREGQVKMVVALLALSGVSGLPFAEDLEDMVDTIRQGLGLQKASIRKELADLADGIVPGSSPFFLTGLMQSFLPGDLASRTSLGNFIPGTGVFLAGSSTTREVAEVAGPAWSMLDGTGTFLVNAFKAATTEQVTLEDVLRSAPITGARMLGDSMAYAASGAIVDKRGYVVSEDLHWGIIFSRLMGFYPSSAANQYSIIRISKRMTDYQREVSAGFRYGWIKAKIRGDVAQARAIEEAVADWNRGAKGTALEIRNFRKNATRALREARRPAIQRLQRSAPIAARQDIARTADILGY